MKASGNIEKLFRDTFSDYEAEVSPSSWERIEQAMEPTAAPDATAGKSAGAGKVSGSMVAGATAVVVGVVAALFYLNAPDTPSPAVNKAVVAVEAPVPAEVLPQEAAVADGPARSAPSLVETSTAPTAAPREAFTAASHERFTANDEIQPLADQEIQAADPVPASVTLPLGSGAVAYAAVKEPAATAPATIPVDVEPVENAPAPASAAGAPAMKTRIAERIEYPNIITPNGDGKNEIFVIETSYIASLRVTVYDLSGNQVHQWTNLHGFWDGRMANGNLAPEGKYLIDIFAIREDGEVVHNPPVALILKR